MNQGMGKPGIPLTMRVEGDEDTRWQLLQKRAGRYYVSLWQTGREIIPPGPVETRTVTVSFQVEVSNAEGCTVELVMPDPGQRSRAGMVPDQPMSWDTK